jgi:hypothetical protein
MDPSYKNFLNWKKSFRGREFLNEIDSNEINDLRQQSKILVNF